MGEKGLFEWGSKMAEKSTRLYSIQKSKAEDVPPTGRNDLQLFWSESWMMKYMLGLDTSYGSPKKASLECERIPEKNKTWPIRMERCATVRKKMTTIVE